MEASRAGPGTSVRTAIASQRLSPQTTRLVETIAPQAVAINTSRQGSFSLRSSRRITKRPKAVVGRQARAQSSATRGPAACVKVNRSSTRSQSTIPAPNRKTARTAVVAPRHYQGNRGQAEQAGPGGHLPDQEGQDRARRGHEQDGAPEQGGDPVAGGTPAAGGGGPHQPLRSTPP